MMVSETRRRQGATVTLGFSSHRPETLPFAAREMRRHRVVVLEDPATPGFRAMLEGLLDVEEYIASTEVEYPEFGRLSCRLLQELHAEGVVIVQVEPFMDALLDIHEHFAAGGEARDFDPDSLAGRVYQVERRASSSLLNYYRVSLDGSFEAALEAVKDFARVDAARTALRDELRAAAVAPLAGEYASLYVEAGYIHFALFRELKKLLPTLCSVRARFLMEPVVRELSGRRHPWGPGDILTLLYVFHPGYRGRRADLLAARSLIYIKIIGKDEVTEDIEHCPHTRDEVETARMVAALSGDDCRVLFPRIRRAPTGEARSMVARYLGSGNGGPESP